MTEVHPTADALEQFLLGQLPTPEMREIARHLLTGCAPCHLAMSGLWEPVDGVEEPFVPAGEEALAEAGAGYDRVLDRVFERVAAAETAIAEQRVSGRKLFEELMEVPAARRHLLLSNSTRFRNRMLCECLVEEGFEAGFHEPGRAVEVATLATVVADRLELEDCGGIEEARNSLRARAWAHLGNAFRVVFDLVGSEGAFAVAESLSEEGPIGLLDKARVLGLLASLRLDQRRLAEAHQLYDRAAFIYKKLGQWSLLGRTLLQKALVCEEAGDEECRMSLLRRALDLIDPQAEPRLFLTARHNLIHALHDSGRSREAFALLFHTRPLYLKTGDRMHLLRLRWLEGLVAFGLQRIDQAEVAFREVRDAFAELGLDYDAALAALDLAGVYIVQGRTGDVRRVAEETLAVFQAHNTHQEAMAALLAFQGAACFDRAGLQLVRDVADFLKRARNNPDLRFAPPSLAGRR